MLVLGTLDVVAPVARENRPVARAPRGCNAIERVAAILHTCEDVVDRGDAQHVPWPAFRHRVADPRARVCDDTLLDRAADAHAGEVQRGDLLGRMPAQVLIVRALHHAVQCLVRFAQSLLGQPLVLGHATLRPTVGAFHGTLLVAARVHQCGQLIEREHDVGADLMLDSH